MGRLAATVGVAALVWTLALGSGAARAQTEDGAPQPAQETIGVSQGGAPLVVYRVGSGATRVLLLGGQHGGPERNTVELVSGLLDEFTRHPSELPVGIEMDVLPVANPDGLATGSRQFLSGVDPNRNWGGSDWRADAYDSNAQFHPGLGGPEPFSEPETRALADWLLRTRPAFVVNYHSAGGFMFAGRDGPSGELAAAYQDATGYAWPAPGRGSSPLPYSATGSMNAWLREAGIPNMLVELRTPYDPESDRNLAGLEALLARLAQGPVSAG